MLLDAFFRIAGNITLKENQSSIDLEALAQIKSEIALL